MNVCGRRVNFEKKSFLLLYIGLRNFCTEMWIVILVLLYSWDSFSRMHSFFEEKKTRNFVHF